MSGMSKSGRAVEQSTRGQCRGSPFQSPGGQPSQRQARVRPKAPAIEAPPVVARGVHRFGEVQVAAVNVVGRE